MGTKLDNLVGRVCTGKRTWNGISITGILSREPADSVWFTNEPAYRNSCEDGFAYSLRPLRGYGYSVYPDSIELFEEKEA